MDWINWIIKNKDWLFSGIGIALPLAIGGWIFGGRKNKQVQKGGNNSTNIQVGGNLTMKSKSNDK